MLSVRKLWSAFYTVELKLHGVGSTVESDLQGVASIDKSTRESRLLSVGSTGKSHFVTF